MPSIHLRNPRTDARCDIELGHGLVYTVEAATAGGLEALLDQLLRQPGAQVAHGVGGMVGNINVLENIALPAVFHGLWRAREFDSKIIEAFAACGFDAEQAETLCRKRPGELGPFEQRLAGFVRGLLLRPEVLVYYRFLEGLTRSEMARAAALDPVYRAWNPASTSVYLFLSDMPDLQLECGRRYVT